MTTYRIHFWPDTRRFTVLDGDRNSGFGEFRSKAAAKKAVRQSAADFDEVEGVDFVFIN